jgi:hypothetical protein
MSQTKKYFSFEELKKLKSLEGKILSDVIYFVWVNRIEAEKPFIFIDKIQLKFQSGETVTLTAGEESDALHFVENFDPLAEALKLDEDFNGKILLKPHNSSGDKFWKDVIHQKVEIVQLSKQNDQYLADAIVFDFGKEKRLVAISPEEGIIIDYHEDD